MRLFDPEHAPIAPDAQFATTIEPSRSIRYRVGIH
jgi:hypothetical protein